MKKIKKYIIFVFIIIVIIISIILGIKINSKNKLKKLEEAGDPGEELELNTTSFKTVEDKNKFYTVSNCVQEYLDQLNINNSAYLDRNGEKIYTEEEIKEYVYDLLDSGYVKSNNIEINNVYDFVEKLNNRMVFIPLKMGVSVGAVVEKYVVYGIEQSEADNTVKKVYIIVNLDNNNKTFSIEPLESKDIKSIEDVSVQNNDTEIKSNDVNGFDETQITYADSIKNYINAYKRIALVSPEDAYNLLDKEYAEKRFGDEKSFANYIQNNKDEIEKIRCEKYKTEVIDGYIRYIGLDQYNNYYIIKEIDPMKISIKLDNYTIVSDAFTKEYGEGSNSHKVLMNIDKWNSMLKSRDYRAAYDVLDETFRNNNFDSEEKFEKYMRENLPSHYELSYSGFSEENGVETQEVSFKDMDNDDNTKNLTIIMKLEEGTDFVMSFSIN